ncbi:hypothetical protein HPP05_10285 [Corallococcus exiguus]|uniref:hypothetical protein n=1 Tax=Corallococcus exiguus TaxID=83462 RepID=UPI001494EAD1|nr:hypothetical protein [Corallococcus exiguus]NPC70130.1 hypothetical protein [Corallococcus exiguus]
MTATLERVRSQVLRSYYETTYGQGGGRHAFDGATLEEYLALGHIVYPRLSDKELLQRAPPHLKELRVAAATASELRPPQVPVQPEWQFVSKKDRVDLGEHVQQPPPRIRLSGVKNIVGLEKVRGSPVERLAFSKSGSEERKVLQPPLHLKELEARWIDPEWLPVLLGSISAEKIWFDWDEEQPWNARALKHMEIAHLQVDVPVLMGLAFLKAQRFVTVYVTCVADPADLKEGLAGSAQTLSELTIGSHVPFGPEVVAGLRNLKRLRIGAYPEFRQQWVDWAVAHREVGCMFEPPVTFIREGAPALAEMHRDIPILVTRPKRGTPKYRVEYDVVGECELDFDDNGDLEDALKTAARQQKKKVQWGSEADTLVVTAADVDTCRWVIDTALGFAT